MIKPRNCIVCDIQLNEKNGYVKNNKYYDSYCRKCDNKKRHSTDLMFKDFKKKYTKEEFEAFKNAHDDKNPAIYLNYLESKNVSI